MDFKLERIVKLVRDYRAAEAAFNAAENALSSHITNRTTPTTAELGAEQRAFMEFVSADRQLYLD